jgi:site-specific DNA-methyltransferase (adenine-specific)/modification methylase
MKPYKRKEVIGDATLYLGDCLEILPTLDKVDAVITDPPYGIDAYGGGTMGGGVLAKQSSYDATNWDKEPCSKEKIDAMIDASKEQVIFGGNYFDLPPARCWLIWDKENGSNNFADAEMAWTNIDGAVRLKRYKWQGMLQGNMKDKEIREHPTQKPRSVMEWAILQCKSDPKIILDPFMGSGTTGVACMNLGRKFIGIEIEEKYFDIACERIDNAQRQGRLFE